MENYQAIEAVYAIRGVAAQDAMNFFTFVSAYCVVAYFVAKKLSKVQLWAITILYSLFCLGPGIAVYISVVDMSMLTYGEQHPVWLSGALNLHYLMIFAWA